MHAALTASVAPGTAKRPSPPVSPPPIEVELAAAAPLASVAPSPTAPAEPIAVTPVARAERRAARPESPVRKAPSSTPRAVLAEAPDSTYYGARELDVYPALAAALDLAFPETAGGTVAAGRVLLLVLIDASGGIDQVSVVEAEPAGVFDGDARRALLAARFRPAQKAGRAVKSRLLVEVSYGAPAEVPR